uniref:SHSP domain-containing protein n=1 Tax=Coccolithus braarudii TaxID=221442 RepID=A0A7S0QB65_9EUKA|mmetsp:Transcript_815/g.1634  ORF Transcript_815/g.1634 Transcript_815/m.1634 type:complete len:367 (+) Transcript_815:24-1124(+)
MATDASPPQSLVAPAKFRCHRKRMILMIRVALHHVHPNQIQLKTTRTAIDLQTSGRRRYRLCREYPRGIECDDSRTTAEMDGHTLVIEMPILKLTPIGGASTPEPEPAAPEVASPAVGTKRKAPAGDAEVAKGKKISKKGMAEASGPAPAPVAAAGSEQLARSATKRSAKKARAVSTAASDAPTPAALSDGVSASNVDEQPSDGSQSTTAAAAAGATALGSGLSGKKRAASDKLSSDPAARASKKARVRDAVAAAGSGAMAGPSGEQQQTLFSMIDEAAQHEDGRREKSLDKMRKFEREEATRKAKAKAKEQKKEEQKKQLLNTAKEMKKAAKAVKSSAVSPAVVMKTPTSKTSKKRVSFSAQLTD